MTLTLPEMRPLVERIDIIEARSSADYAAIFELRRQVFKVEKKMDGTSVEDADDRSSLLALALAVDGDGDARPVGTGRLTLGAGAAGEGVVTWVATAADARGRGIGGAVMRFLLDAADQAGAPAVTLAAQAPAIPFYRRMGFVSSGRIYTSSGIDHLPMVRFRPAPGRITLGWRMPRSDW